jgi:enterochelin esterase-like enzyme
MKYLLVGLLIFSLTSCSDAQEVPTPFAGEIIRHENFQSKFVDARHVEVWLPEGYSDDQAYPVLYMHDGQNLFDANVTWNNQEWMVDEIITALAVEAKIPPMIVVGVFNGGEMRHPEYFPQKPFETLTDSDQYLLTQGVKKSDLDRFKKVLCSDDYLRFLVQELKPFIDDTYQTLSDRPNTFIGGSSMGGLISMYAICEYPNVFAGAACISTHWPGFGDFKDNPVPGAFAQYLKENLPDPTNHKIWFDHGTATLDATYGTYQTKVDQVMQERGFLSENWITKVYEGADHSEKSWQKRFDEALLFLMSE